MVQEANRFLSTLNADQQEVAQREFGDTIRYDWNFTPRKRSGLTLKDMNAAQRSMAMGLLKLALSDEGYGKTLKIIDLENVLRVVENRPPNDIFRDPENFSFLFFGKPGAAAWGWRMEGHHVSLHFASVDGKISFHPGFMGSNPAEVQAEVPQKGLRVLKDEQDYGFSLLNSLDGDRRSKALIGSKAPREIISSNVPKLNLKQAEGLAYGEMTSKQQEIFLQLIRVYLNRYHVTLKNQQMAQLEKVGLDKIHFAWLGDQTPLQGTGHGHYYRIQGPTLLIEYDNTQNGANHIHSVVRDLTNDFGEDMLRRHYQTMHSKKQR